MNNGESLPLWAWALLIIVLLSQGIWLFQDAKKRDAKYWFWGIWGLTNVPSVLIIYLLVVRGGYAAIIKKWKGREKHE